MSSKKLSVVALLMLGVGACGEASDNATDSNQEASGTPRVNLSGKTQAAAIQHIADVYCSREVECGVPKVSCTARSVDAGAGQPSEEPLTCTGRLVAGNYQECVREYRAELEEEFTACGYEGFARLAIEGCVNGYLAQPCVMEADLTPDALAEPEEEEVPEACLLLEELWGDC